jgi:hypothetical protein
VLGSEQSRTTAAVAINLRFASGLRAAFMIASDVLVDGFGRNADAALRTAVLLGFARIRRAECPIPICVRARPT